MNRKRGKKGQRDVVAVAWQRFWDVRSAWSPSRWWWWTSLLLYVDGRVQGVLLAGAVVVAVVAGCVLVDVTGGGRGDGACLGGRHWSCLGGIGDGLFNGGRRCGSHACHGW